MQTFMRRVVRAKLSDILEGEFAQKRGGPTERLSLDALVDTVGGAGRYVCGALPELPFQDDAFDLVLCSHYLFLYSHDLSLDRHLAALREMLRVGSELRVFPLLDMEGRTSVHLAPAMEALADTATVELVSVPFEFQRGATQMLRLRRKATPSGDPARAIGR